MQQLLADLQARGANAALLELDDTLAVLRPALERRGFHALLHSWAFSLDPRTCDLAAFAAPDQRLRGLQITTLAAELARGADWLPPLHQLYSAVAGDVPIPSTRTPRHRRRGWPSRRLACPIRCPMPFSLCATACAISV